MLISEVARQAGVSTKTVRYYESMGLITAPRLANGYRDYDENQARLVAEVHALGRLGIRAEQARPFLDCLVSGHRNRDDCPDSLATYRQAIAEMDGRIHELTSRRAALAALLDEAAERSLPRCQFTPEESHVD